MKAQGTRVRLPPPPPFRLGVYAGIIIRKPEISYEKTFTGSNVKELLKNIEEFSEPAPEVHTDAKK